MKKVSNIATSIRLLSILLIFAICLLMFAGCKNSTSNNLDKKELSIEELSSRFFTESKSGNYEEVYELFAETSILSNLYRILYIESYEGEEPTTIPSREEIIDSINEFSSDCNPQSLTSWIESDRGLSEEEDYFKILIKEANIDCYEISAVSFNVTFTDDEDSTVTLFLIRTDNGWSILCVDG